jgi:hypothetical protein
MKTLFKISSLALVVTALSFGAKAQTTTQNPSTSSSVRLSAGVDAGLPVGDFSDTHNWSLGGSLQADIPVVKQLFVTVNGGYNNIFGKSINGSSLNYTDVQLIPVKAGLKYFPLQNVYIQGEAGASFLVNKNDLAANNSTAFVYAPQVGVVFPVGGKSFIDAGVRFENTQSFYTNGNSFSTLGLRVAYAFGL